MLIMDDFFFPSSTFMYEYKNLCNLALRVFHKSILGKRRVLSVHVLSVHVLSVHVLRTTRTSITTFSTWLNCSDYCCPFCRGRFSDNFLSRPVSLPVLLRGQGSPGRLWVELVEGGVFLLFRLSRSRDVNLLYSNDNSNKDDTQKLHQRRRSN